LPAVPVYQGGGQLRISRHIPAFHALLAGLFAAWFFPELLGGRDPGVARGVVHRSPTNSLSRHIATMPTTKD
jgi:hypothetical protein